MSATPIPRTLGDELLRRPRRLDHRRAAARAQPDRHQDHLRTAGARKSSSASAPRVAQGRQAYWVCPLIEESEALDLGNATATHLEPANDGRCGNADGPVLVGLLHSRMPPAEKKR